MSASTTDRWLKPLVFLLCSLPLIGLAPALLTGALNPDPIQALTHTTGEWALRLPHCPMSSRAPYPTR